MSISAHARRQINLANRPPLFTEAFWNAFGTQLRRLGKAVDSVGASMMKDAAYVERLPIPTTARAIGGAKPDVHQKAFVAPSANLLGAVTMAPHANAWYSSVLKGDGAAPCSIGEGSSVSDRAIVEGSKIGDATLVGAGALVATNCVIGSGCSIGMGAKLGEGCKVGDGAVIAAGSVVAPKTDIAPRTVWSGNPAAEVGKVSDVDEEGLADAATLSAALSLLHRNAAWMAYADLEIEHDEYKIEERTRSEYHMSQLREDPGWEKLPTLAGYLEEVKAYDCTYVPK